MERILVTGATGFIGLEVARQLAGQGRRPRLMVRRPGRGALLVPLEAEIVYGELRQPASLARVVKGIDTVLHLGARAVFERYERVKPTIVDGSVALMRAAAEAGVRQFVFASSLLVYGDREEPIDAATPAKPTIAYARAKVEAEDALARLAEAAGMGFAAIRLPHVYGARSLFLERVRTGLLVVPGRGENPCAHLHVDDAARALIAVAEKGWRGVSPVADTWPATWNQFFEVLRLYYARFRIVRIPAPAARLGAQLLEPFLRLRSAPALVTVDTVSGWNFNLSVDPDALWSEIATRPRYPDIEHGIPAALDDCVAFRWRHSVADRAS